MVNYLRYKINKIFYIIIAIFIIKILLLVLFSSDYQNKIYIPFISTFLDTLKNPWQYYYQHKLHIQFPYPPALLYIESIFYAPAKYFFLDNLLLRNLFFKLPTLFSDFLITFLFIKLYPKKLKEITIFYIASPIIIYAAYIHSQMDLIPVAVLFLSIFLFIKKKYILSAIVYGIAISIKLPAITVLPFLILYNYKNGKIIDAIKLAIIPIIVNLLIVLPYIFSEGYKIGVLNNNEQYQLLDLFIKIGSVKIYLVPLAFIIICFKFAGYFKINRDLLFSYISLSFSIFIILIPPMPNWYIWVGVFASIVFVIHRKVFKNIELIYLLLISSYLFYFLFLYIPANNNVTFNDMTFLSTKITIRINNDLLKNISFTILEATMIVVIYQLFNYGIKSNLLYRKKTYPTIIGIGGDSSSGKTTVMEDIKVLLGQENVVNIEGDDDHKWERGDSNWKSYSHLNPKANYLHKQADNLKSLKMLNSIIKSEYDHTTGKFKRPIKVMPNEYIIISGLHPFYLPKSRKTIDIKIYCDIQEKLRMHWKILRDMRERGYSREIILDQIESRVTDAEKYIYPQKIFADLIICYFTDDEFEIGNKNYTPNLKLKVTLNANIQLEEIVKRIRYEGVDVIHDYEDDLKTQYLLFINPIPNKLSVKLLDEFIQNIEEIANNHNICLASGYRGFIQFIILLVIGENLKGEDSYSI